MVKNSKIKIELMPNALIFTSITVLDNFQIYHIKQHKKFCVI